MGKPVKCTQPGQPILPILPDRPATGIQPVADNQPVVPVLGHHEVEDDEQRAGHERDHREPDVLGRARVEGGVAVSGCSAPVS